ncbi:hypothetical protein ACGFK1_31815 [Mycobacterium sp. NPDC048908]|uniref:hypothetical protein n=1 Tax=Mycobacterium sp. NPDC048908 TaxID=3364292 RepID=UPI0037241484
MRHRLTTLCAIAVLAAGCSGATVVNTSDTPSQPTAAPSAAPSPAPSNAHLVNAFDYVGHDGDTTGYYFTTPSGKWKCAILTHTKAGCQAASSWQSGLGVDGEPDSTNAIVVAKEGDPQFVELDQPQFALPSESAKVLQFNKILAAAGFRCNVQESGVSCLSESSGKGFTFSSDGYVPQYTDVPTGAP